MKRSSSPTFMQGSFLDQMQLSGLAVHTFDGLEKNDEKQSFIKPAGLTIGILIEGELDFELNGERRVLRCGQDEPALCFAIASAKAYQIVRRLKSHRKVKKLVISSEYHWLIEHCDESPGKNSPIKELFQKDLNFWTWTADMRSTEVALSLLNPEPRLSQLQRLYRESGAYELLGSAILHVADKPQEEGPKEATVRAKELIDQHLLMRSSGQDDEARDLDSVARICGISVSTLQRQFKQHYGVTVGNYIRRRRLERARDALHQNELSIGEAAYAAGYRHVSNFATAYKRAFGCTPGLSTVME